MASEKKKEGYKVPKGREDYMFSKLSDVKITPPLKNQDEE